MIYTKYKESNLFPNQVIQGRDPDLYANKKPERPRRYHKKLRLKDKKHLYPDLFPDETDDKKPDTEDKGEENSGTEEDGVEKV